MTENSKLLDAAKEIKLQQKLLHAVNEAAQILLASIAEDTFEASVMESMKILAHCLDVDRGYIWQNVMIDDILHYVMRFEWQSDTGHKTNPVRFKAIYPYNEIPGWQAKFLKNECVNGTLDDLSQEEQDRLRPHGMISVFAIPVFIQNNFWGWVSFDDCRRARSITDAEINILRSVSLMLASAINRNEQAIKYHNAQRQRNNLLYTVNNVANKLLQAEVDEFEKALQDSLEMLGEAVNADRVYIWRNFSKDEKLYCSQKYEWSKGAEPQQNNEYTIDVPYEHMPGWEERLSHGQCINGIVHKMDKWVQEQLTPQGILSILVVPVFLRDRFWGFVGFDDCHNERIFSENEETILLSGSLLIAHAMLRNDLTLGIRATAMELESALEEAQAASHAKSNFLSNMSHEMRTPMNAIIGMTQIGKSSADTEKKDYAFKQIEAASNHLLGVINDVLDMSKIEAGKFELSNAEFEFDKLIQKAINIIGFRIKEKQQNFTQYIDSDIPKFLYGDDQRLTQVITNLLTNAVKFTPENGSITLKAHFAGEENGKCTIMIEVKDTGIGISPEQQARLFTSFEQAESTISRKFGGTGLGLAICKWIVELMGGRIWLESELGKGSVFAFTVQMGCNTAMDGATGGKDSGEEGELEEILSFKGKRLLLAEDVEINREIVISLLEPLEIEIDCAVNGLEAVKMFTASPEKYDLIFMDLQMPQMDGLEATQKIRAFEAELKAKQQTEKVSTSFTEGETQSYDRNLREQIPIIAMTANVFKEDIDKCIDAGMNAHIGKPLDLNEMTELMKRYL